MEPKSLVVAVALAVTTLTLACTAQAATAVEAAEASATLHVEGMHCPSCSVTVKAALKKLDGVRDAKVSAKDKRAVVTYDPARVTPEQMVQALKDAGYNASVEAAK